MTTRHYGHNSPGQIPTRVTGPETPPELKRTPADGETHWSQASGEGTQKAVPKQFSEIDESASSQRADSASMGVVGKLAHDDTVGPVVDTDIGPVLDAVYNGPVTEGDRTTDRDETLEDPTAQKSDAEKKTR